MSNVNANMKAHGIWIKSTEEEWLIFPTGQVMKGISKMISLKEWENSYGKMAMFISVIGKMGK